MARLSQIYPKLLLMFFLLNVADVNEVNYKRDLSHRFLSPQIWTTSSSINSADAYRDVQQRILSVTEYFRLRKDHPLRTGGKWGKWMNRCESFTFFSPRRWISMGETGASAQSISHEKQKKEENEISFLLMLTLVSSTRFFLGSTTLPTLVHRSNSDHRSKWVCGCIVTVVPNAVYTKKKKKKKKKKSHSMTEKKKTKTKKKDTARRVCTSFTNTRVYDQEKIRRRRRRREATTMLPYWCLDVRDLKACSERMTRDEAKDHQKKEGKESREAATVRKPTVSFHIELQGIPSGIVRSLISPAG